MRRLADGNKRLAMLGDAVLNITILHDWYSGTDTRIIQFALLN